MKRPVGITIVGILILLMGVISVLSGIVGIIAYAADSAGVGVAMLPLTVIVLIFGVIYLLVAKGIFGGSPVARIIVAIVTVLSLVASVIQLFTTDQKAASVLAILIDVVILWILYGTKGKEFFTQR